MRIQVELSPLELGALTQALIILMGTIRRYESEVTGEAFEVKDLLFKVLNAGLQAQAPAFTLREGADATRVEGS